MTLLAAVMERMKALNMTLMMLINSNVLGFSLLDRGTPENLENFVKIIKISNSKQFTFQQESMRNILLSKLLPENI